MESIPRPDVSVTSKHRCEIALGDFSPPRAVAGGSERLVTPACTPTVQTGKRVCGQGGLVSPCLGYDFSQGSGGCHVPWAPAVLWAAVRVEGAGPWRSSGSKWETDEQMGIMRPGPGGEPSGEQTGRSQLCVGQASAHTQHWPLLS